MDPTSPLLEFAQDRLQIFALLFMATVYTLKIRWILRFPPGRDRQAPGGRPGTGASAGARRSLWAVALPWSVTSMRRHPWFYAQFVLFHLGVAASIAMSFVIPYRPGWLAHRGVVWGLQALFAAAAAVGCFRMARRIVSPYLRAISSPDDYFSLALLIVWLVLASLAAPNDRRAGETALLAYFLLTAFFLAYVPFSKISHYIYYPFTRWYLGKTLGHRGVYPVMRGA